MNISYPLSMQLHYFNIKYNPVSLQYKKISLYFWHKMLSHCSPNDNKSSKYKVLIEYLLPRIYSTPNTRSALKIERKKKKKSDFQTQQWRPQHQHNRSFSYRGLSERFLSESFVVQIMRRQI